MGRRWENRTLVQEMIGSIWSRIIISGSDTDMHIRVVAYDAVGFRQWFAPAGFVFCLADTLGILLCVR